MTIAYLIVKFGTEICQEILLVLCLAIPTFESVNGVGDINVRDKLILSTLSEVQDKVLMMIKRSTNLTEQATFIIYKSRLI